MVVSRRNPVAPPPVASRSNSAQAIPRKQKQTPQQSPLTPATATTTSVTAESPRKSKRRTKSKAGPRTLSILDRLFLFSLFGFLVYAATVCSSPLWRSSSEVPYHQQPLVCRSLTTYRTAVLEPYVLPPLKVAYEHSLGHPAVQAQLKTHAQPYVEIARGYSKPVVDVMRQVNERAVKPVVEVAYGKVWKAYLVPWYYRAYLPRYRMYVAPRLQAGWEKGVREPLKPYEDLLKIYARDAQVYVHTHVIHPVKKWYFGTVHPVYVKYEPQIRSAYNKAEPVVCQVYSKVQDVLITAWTYARPHLCKAWKQARAYFGVAVTEGGKARRTYVDPHVHKILERVSASASPLADGAEPAPTSASAPEPTPTEAEETIESIPVTPPVEAQEVLVEEKKTPPSPSPVEAAADEHEQVTPVATPSSTPSPSVKVNAGSVAEESAAPSSTSSLEPQPTEHAENVAEQIANSFVERVIMLKKMEEERIAAEAAAASASSASASVTETASSATTTESVASPTPAAAPEDDLDDFLADIGLSSGTDATPGAPEEEVAAPEPTPLSQEELLAATAEKRKDIVARHQDWQRQLDNLAEEQIVKVVKDIEGVRAWAVSELGDEYATVKSPSGSDNGDSKYRKTTRAEGEQGLGKRAMGGVERAGGKLVKGLESYLGKAIERSDVWKMSRTAAFPSDAEKAKSQEEKEKWGEVLAKVEDRFNNVVKGVQGEVHEWYKSMKGREADTVGEAALAVKHLAEKAQADLAMDYAWLDDVTYKDWELYHQLMRIYDNFDKIARSIQDGTYAPAEDEEPFPTPGPDPLVGALDKLQSELDDIVLGFQVALGAIKKKGIKIFSERRYKNYEGREGDEDDTEGFFSVKREKGELVDDMRGTPEYQGEAKKPLVSILPVNPGSEGDEQEQRVKDASAILIGKDPVQVAQAVSRASAAGATVVSSAASKETERVKDEL